MVPHIHRSQQGKPYMVVLVEDDEGNLAGTFQTRDEVTVYLKGLEDGGIVLDKFEDDTVPTSACEEKAYAAGLADALKVPVTSVQAIFSRAIARMVAADDQVAFSQGAVIRLMNEMELR